MTSMIARFFDGRGIDRVARRHLSLLLLLTFLIQGVMYLSYPLPATNYDDNQAAQSYLIGELLSGNPLIGNVRYNTGYAFIMVPVRALTRTLGNLDDRAFLLVQMLAYSAIPFMVYDMMRRRFDRRTAFISALVTLVDPFGLQWAHLQLPGWLIALATVWALWLAQLAWSANQRHRLKLVALAAIGLGWMTVARLNFLPLVAVFGGSFLFWRHIPARHRLALFTVTGCISGGILGAYIIVIHIPSTGSAALSCISGVNLLQGAQASGIPLLASNGPRSREYANLLTLESNVDSSFYGHTYPNWRNTDSWASEAARREFLAQPYGKAQEEIRILFPDALYWILGPCEADALLRAVFWEAIESNEAKLFTGALSRAVTILLQLDSNEVFPTMYLDHAETMGLEGEERYGFRRAHSNLYNGHLLWYPGAAVFSALFSPLNSVKLLTIFAIIAACWKRDWLLVTLSALLLAGAVTTAAITSLEPRYYAMLAPLYSMLLGWFLARILWRITGGAGANRAVSSPARNSP